MSNNGTGLANTVMYGIGNPLLLDRPHEESSYTTSTAMADNNLPAQMKENFALPFSENFFVGAVLVCGALGALASYANWSDWKKQSTARPA